MVIENKKTVTQFHLRRLILIIILTIAVVLLLYIKFFDKQTLGFEQKYLIFGLIVVYFIYYFWGLARNYYYVFFSDLGPAKLVFRFYSLAPLSKKQKSIELRKDEFHKFEIINKALGLRKYLIIYQRTPRGIAKYPPISISMMSEKQVRELSESLSTYLPG